ncbi:MULTISPECIES: arginine--tRNA ligase [unclassified Spirosoma]|uniref:arginine--tRNA ligase n=1 Tax=unclassified Spirosoma TaxID=2621999 RepID=UPI000968334B|nr:MULTISPECIES: arginine--tRNA ligase [unclassified Spirosoma]MBN8826272.1 arginine--tRNA ligase [Spirosoma sp.]OJW75216.1 MAG: arginine--tRNA ligase [Spirosoma sp. 48-14]
MDIQEELKSAIQRAVSELYQQESGEVSLQPTKKEFDGLYTFVTFPLTKALRQAPAQIGQAIGNWLVANSEIVSGFNVVQGFLNISIADAAWIEVLNDIAGNPSFGQLASKGKSVMVEFSSPNTNKPLHLGHLRNNFLGDSVSRILAANGYDVVKTCIVNDRGVHICKSMLAYKLFGNDETPEQAGMKGDHLVGKYYVLFDKAYKQQVEEMVGQGMPKEEAEKKAPLMLEVQQMLRLWEQGDPETVSLWRKLNDWVYTGFDATYQSIGVSFDKTYYESNTYVLGKEIVEEGLQKGVFYRKDDGSVWIDLTDQGLDQKLVLRSDGTSVYMTQDLGTTDLKYQDFHNDRQIWVVGNEQDYHFNVLFAILRRLGRPYANNLYHLSYGMVDLPTGKMKSREGTVVDADDLIQETTEAAAMAADDAAKGKLDEFTAAEKASLFHMLGLGALKYYLLKVDPQKRMQFNPAESVDLHGNTGPYIQYVHARIQSILRKATEADIALNGNISDTQLDEIEQQLVFLLSQYPQRVKEAGDDFAPSYLAQYAYELAKTFNQFYDKLPILKETDPVKLQTRLVLAKCIGETIQKAMGLLGIEVPQKM